MFVVGKKYTYRNYTYVCLGVHLFRKGEVAGIMQFDGKMEDDPKDMGDIPSVRVWSDEWVEYHEPVIVKCIRRVIGGNYPAEHLTTTDHNSTYGKQLGVVEFTITDGKLTDVRIVS